MIGTVKAVIFFVFKFLNARKMLPNPTQPSDQIDFNDGNLTMETCT